MKQEGTCNYFSNKHNLGKHLAGKYWSGNLHTCADELSLKANKNVVTGTEKTLSTVLAISQSVIEKGVRASGNITGYSWFFQARATSWSLEIAEDQSIKPCDLPLVGYGCGGWLYDCSETLFSEEELSLHLNSYLLTISALSREQFSPFDFIEYYLTEKLEPVFVMFQQNKLHYLPAVSCPCSD